MRAVANVNHEINSALAGEDFDSQSKLDQCLIDLDGTPNKSRLGANAILSVSLAFCRAQAAQGRQPLFEHLAKMAGTTPRLPQPMINLFSGGAHAGGQIALQDVQIVVLGAQSIRQTLEVASDIFRAGTELIASRYGMRLLTADEGGLAPPFEASGAMLHSAVESIESAGYKAGADIALTVDVAASQFYVEGRYLIDGEALDRPEW